MTCLETGGPSTCILIPLVLHEIGISHPALPGPHRIQTHASGTGCGLTLNRNSKRRPNHSRCCHIENSLPAFLVLAFKDMNTIDIAEQVQPKVCPVHIMVAHNDHFRSDCRSHLDPGRGIITSDWIRRSRRPGIQYQDIASIDRPTPIQYLVISDADDHRLYCRVMTKNLRTCETSGTVNRNTIAAHPNLTPRDQAGANVSGKELTIERKTEILTLSIHRQ